MSVDLLSQNGTNINEEDGEVNLLLLFAAREGEFKNIDINPKIYVLNLN